MKTTFERRYLPIEEPETPNTALQAKKATPGPWLVRHYGGNGETPTPRIVGLGARLELATLTLLRDGSHEHNARLIAAAPDLLEALQRTADLAHELMEWAATIDRMLIAKDGREPDCELGEIVRLRQQLSRNLEILEKAGVA